MNKEVIVREITNKVRNDKKLNNKEKEYMLCIANDWFLFKQRIDKAIEYIKDTPKIVKSTHLRDKGSNFIFIENKVKEELLEILKGEENE